MATPSASRNTALTSDYDDSTVERGCDVKVGEYCKRSVASIAASMDISEAAQTMRKEHVGFLVVYRDDDELRKPIGVLTDRDLVLGVMAMGIDPCVVTAADVMTAKPVIARETDDLTDAMQVMRTAGVRRIPVVDNSGALTGIFALDDAIVLVGGLLSDITGSIGREQWCELRNRTS